MEDEAFPNWILSPKLARPWIPKIMYSNIWLPFPTDGWLIEKDISDVTYPKQNSRFSLPKSALPSVLSMCALHVSHIQLFVTWWTVACQAPLSMIFSRQEYWNGFPFPPSGDLPNPGFKPGSSALQADPYKGRRFLKKLLNKHTAIIWSRNPIPGHISG